MVVHQFLSQRTQRKNTIKTNILSANKATCTRAGENTTGFTALKSSVLTPISDEQLFGTMKTLKVTTPNAADAEGVSMTGNTVSTSTAHTAIGYIYAPNAAAMYFAVSDDVDKSTVTSFTGDGSTFKKVTAAITTDAHTSLVIKVYTNGQKGIDFHLGQLILRQGTY